jgi:hypothetical protein
MAAGGEKVQNAFGNKGSVIGAHSSWGAFVLRGIPKINGGFNITEGKTPGIGIKF